MKKKTKKIILLISTILGLTVSIGYIGAIASGALELSVVGDVTQISYESQLAILFICAFVNIFSIGLISKDIIAHKKKIIILNVIQLLFGTMFNIICAIVNIVILTTKTKDVEEKVKEKT